MRARFFDDIAEAAVDQLRLDAPKNSAAGVLSVSQAVLVLLGAAALGAGFFNAPVTTLIVLNAFVTLYFIAAIAFRAFLMVRGAAPVRRSAPLLEDHALPIVTILLPLYKDADALPALAAAMGALDYPAEKLDIKLLLEADDRETIEEARRLRLDEVFETIICAPRGPRTKPRACNYGMHLARGELIVIYDAEDQPEPDQLRKAATLFHEAPAALACVQARLNYYNAKDNWITRQFTLEYSLWFDWLLPALQRIGAPIPLGGTSNFLRTDALLEVGGWDPYNVTEDADLGLRLSKLGYRVEILDSTTFEEANCRMGNWIRQRSRWMKGYLQTWLVHMRDPKAFVDTTGWRGLLAVQLFVAGNVFSALINPVLWGVFLVWLFTRTDAISAVFPGPLLWFNLFALTIGNLFFVALAMAAPLKRGWLGLSLHGLMAPAYWLLTSLAAYKALGQLFTKPYYWEKTDHNLSAEAQRRRDDALSGKL